MPAPPDDLDSAAPAAADDSDHLLARRLAKFDTLLADILHPPEVEAVDTSAYAGLAGQVIRVIARDDFAVVRVTVRLVQADGNLLEEGDATQQTNPLEWLYLTRQTNTKIAGTRLTVRALDRPGNQAEAAVAL